MVDTSGFYGYPKIRGIRGACTLGNLPVQALKAVAQRDKLVQLGLCRTAGNNAISFGDTLLERGG